jgi:GNAT superfamily N-acetyltransferase
MPDIRPFEPTPAGLADLSQLFRTCFPFGAHMDADYIDWTYRGNPDGRTIALDARVDGGLAAHFALTAFRARVRGVQELGVQIQHAATHPAHRGRGLFVSLVERALELAAQAGYGFAVGLPNFASTRTFCGRLGFLFVAPLDVRIGVGAAPRRRPRAGRALEFERIFGADALAWRLARPDRPYRARRDGGCVRVFSARGVRGIPVELGTYPQALVPRDLPPFAAKHPLRAWIGLDPERSWRGRPHLKLPLRLRPAPLNLVFRDLTGARRALDPRRVRADMLDYDPF